MYIQTFILVRKAFFLEQTQIIQFHHKKINKHSKTGILMKLTKKTWQLLPVAYGLGTKFLANSCVNVCTDITPLSAVMCERLQ